MHSLFKGLSTKFKDSVLTNIKFKNFTQKKPKSLIFLRQKLFKDPAIIQGPFNACVNHETSIIQKRGLGCGIVEDATPIGSFKTSEQ